MKTMGGIRVSIVLMLHNKRLLARISNKHVYLSCYSIEAIAKPTIASIPFPGQRLFIFL